MFRLAEEQIANKKITNKKKKTSENCNYLRKKSTTILCRTTLWLSLIVQR